MSQYLHISPLHREKKGGRHFRRAFYLNGADTDARTRCYLSVTRSSYGRVIFIGSCCSFVRTGRRSRRGGASQSRRIFKRWATQFSMFPTVNTNSCFTLIPLEYSAGFQGGILQMASNNNSFIFSFLDVWYPGSNT